LEAADGGRQQKNGIGIVAVELFHSGRQEQRSNRLLSKASRRVGWVKLERVTYKR
jgi:hypothetical protein